MISEIRRVAAFEVIGHALKEYGKLQVTAAVEIEIRHTPYIAYKYGKLRIRPECGGHLRKCLDL